MTKQHTNAWALALATLAVGPVWAQSAADPMSMDHSQHGAMPDTQALPKAAPAATPKTAPASLPSSAPAAMPDMDHGTMDHGTMTKPTDVSKPTITPDASPATPAGDMAGMDHGASATKPASAAMDHGDMKMQGGPAPADARDPHAYSGGTTLTSGPYARPPGERMRMADEHHFGSVLVDRLERGYTSDGNSTSYDTQAWFGRDYDRLVIKAEGEVAQGKLQEGRTEVLWGHAIATFWDSQLGVRFDNGVGPDRGWLALGVQGLAPYWFEVDATAYVGDEGRTALRLGAEYELLLTQKLILQPRVELNVYGKRDAERGLGSGLAESQAGLRLRYEFSRQFAPYIGVERVSKYGETAKLARDDGEKDGETRWVAGVRFWF
ncbi:MAG: copper resistance protein B [Thiobacillus sp.]|nr:copper resistance protein B [Thiobacillus sp.]